MVIILFMMRAVRDLPRYYLPWARMPSLTLMVIANCPRTGPLDAPFEPWVSARQ